MKKFRAFLVNLFTKNIGIKLSAIAIAALVVIFLNLKGL